RRSDGKRLYRRRRRLASGLLITQPKGVRDEVSETGSCDCACALHLPAFTGPIVDCGNHHGSGGSASGGAGAWRRKARGGQRGRGREAHGLIQSIGAGSFSVIPDKQNAPVQFVYADVQHVENNLSLGATIVLIVLIAAGVLVA